MQAFVGNPLRRGARQPVSPAFAHALMREVMKTPVGSSPIAVNH